MSKKLFSLFLVLVMVTSILSNPATISAEETFGVNGRLEVTAYDQTNGAELAGGTIACETVEESVTGKTQYDSSNVAEGSKVTVTATPAEGYRFVRWEKQALDAPVTVSTNPVYEFTFTENPTVLNAVFEVKPLTITLVPTTIDGSKPVENYEFEILPGESFRDLDGTEAYDAAVDHFKTAEGYSPYSNDLYLLPKELSNYTSWDEVEDADMYYYALNEAATYYVAMRKLVTETEIPVTVEAPVCGTETSFVVDDEEVVDPDSAVNMPVVKIESDKVQPYRNSAAKRFWWTTEDATTYGDIFNGRFVGGNKYGVLLQFEPAFGYVFDKNNPATVKVNGTVADTKVYSSSRSIDVISIITAEHNWDEGIVDPEPTCTEPGVKTCACTNNGEDWHGEDASVTEAVEALGHDWGPWKVTKEATATEDGEETRTCSRRGETETRVIPHLEAEYQNVEGDGSTWEKGSTKSLEFIFKRNINDEDTFSHFKGIQVDGKDVDKENYTADSGSVVINLKPAYLETLAVGKHTLTAVFDDGKTSSATFTITEKKESTAPKTGDANSQMLWIAILCGSFAILINRAKEQRKIGR